MIEPIAVFYFFMTTEQTKKILIRIQAIETDLETLKQCRLKIAESGYASATLASGGGSRSYTRLNLGDISKLIQELTNELKSLRKLLSGGQGGQPGYILTVYC